MRTACIVGGGVIGGGWAARFLLSGWNVRVFDPDPEAERKITAVLDRARRTLPMLYEVALPAEGTLTYHETLQEALEGAEWVTESVPERLDLKHRIYAEIQGIRPDITIGSSTSGFTPTELTQGAAVPARIIVTHPFNPVYLLPLVEVVGKEGGDAKIIEEAREVLSGIGMYPLYIRKEIAAHIADRFLEAVWREALWLINDGIATTEEIDNAIRYAFGIRWAQMGLFETYRLGGGEDGMRHFIAQFGPTMSFEWTKLMDVPELTEELIDTIADQSDAQSGHMTIDELAGKRDGNLVALIRALKQQGSAAGLLVQEHEAKLAPQDPVIAPEKLRTIERVIPCDWTDYNGHMNESRYGQLWSDAADTVMRMVGADAAYIEGGNSYFTVETTTRFLAEAHAGDRVEVRTTVIEGAGKKLHLFHEMLRGEEVCATCAQLLIHVSLETRRACEPQGDVATHAAALAKAHEGLPKPE
ncbi:carnitine 3-dehydrogenase [Alphaproteobacteria bacterium KMM 3653]|uniref:L-carnitine dehydrogenase n=1 Tax=Harenicola maris TaxID=2841044 RepID=A0AAP2CP28_9RHOB|nr:carnitine 3-dehydrogenase [Harenicola maris]